MLTRYKANHLYPSNLESAQSKAIHVPATPPNADDEPSSTMARSSRNLAFAFVLPHSKPRSEKSSRIAALLYG